MKKIKLIHALASCIFGVFIMIMDGCSKSGDTTTTPSPSCSTAGTTVNTGTSTGGYYSTSIGTDTGKTAFYSYQDFIEFNNTDVNLSVYTVNIQGIYNVGTTAGTILDAGQQSCLDFSYSGTPTASSVAFINGEGYVGKFSDGHIVKFLAINYNSGIGRITYVFQ
jgi:hypothetical protein